MGPLLNNQQAKFLANFYLDIAKGLVLGGISLAIVGPLEIKIIYVFLSGLGAIYLVKIALKILEEIE